MDRPLVLFAAGLRLEGPEEFRRFPVVGFFYWESSR
jgi:hypothetical protein